MSRHNRRRTRGGHKTSTSQSLPGSSPSSLPSSLSMNISGGLYYPISSFPNPKYTSRPSYPPGLGWGFTPSAPVAMASTYHRSTTSARHWHNRYMAWQAREKRQREERTRLEEEKRKIFGMTWEFGVGASPANGNYDGECTADLDEDGLTEKMLEYFGGLDFIE